jgi:hypothetical protein
LARRKPQLASVIPNNPVPLSTEEQAAHLDAIVTVALSRKSGDPLMGRRYRRWELRPAFPEFGLVAANLGLVGVGDPEPFPFDAAALEDFVYWREDAEWLDRLADAPVLDPAANRSLGDLLRRVGDLGDLAAFSEPLPPGNMYLPSVIVALQVLRTAWLMSRAIQLGDVDEAWESYTRRPRSRVSPGAFGSPADSLLGEMRIWFVRQLLVYRLDPVINVEQDPLRHYRVAIPPQNPVQAVLLATAIGAGAAEAPVQALFICAYQPCSATFVAERSRARGDLRFCSRRCGQRYHSTKNTYAKRAAAREARERQKYQEG